MPRRRTDGSGSIARRLLGSRGAAGGGFRLAQELVQAIPIERLPRRAMTPPWRSERPRNAAGLEVAARRASAGVKPAFTSLRCPVLKISAQEEVRSATRARSAEKPNGKERDMRSLQTARDLKRAMTVLVTSLVALSGIVRCDSEMTGPGAAREGLTLAGLRSFSGWSSAMSIEAAPPGAHEKFNTAFTEGCPFVSRDGKSFYIASARPDDPAWLGGLDIYVSTRAGVDDPWGEPVNVGSPVNSAADDFCPTIDRDGHAFYFVSRRQEGIQGVDWCGGGDIYETRLRSGSFDEPVNLGCTLNSAAEEFSPFPVYEPGSGPVLYFSSTRPGLGSGGDLYRSDSHGGVFGPAELVPGVNSAVDDGQPNLRRDALELFFYSSRSGDNDIYVATRLSTAAPWSTPVNLGVAINSAASETRPSLSWDGTTLYFGTTREGTSDIYVATREALRGP